MRFFTSALVVSLMAAYAAIASARSTGAALEQRAVGVVAGLTPLEQPTKLLFGAWIDMIGGADSPRLINERFDYKKLGMFQTNMNMPDDLANITNLINLVEETNTDAIFYLTVYPMQGFEAVTTEHITQLGNALNTGIKNGRRFMIRYAPEMNGNWFKYGQDPVKFLASWKIFVDTLRAMLVDKTKLAFLWAPNSSNGYPFVGGEHQPLNNSAIISILDTNKDGKYDQWDDPYSPFYPGDDYVDWVGLSMYHYGKAYPWVDNVIPQPGVFEAMLTGRVDYTPLMGAYNFYSMFSGDGRGQNITTPVSKGGKPFMIAETAATFHQGWLFPNQTIGQETFLDPGPGMVSIKRAWWQQIFNQTVFVRYPKLKGVCFFEFRKQEESTLREFRTLGDHLAGNGEADTTENAVAAQFKLDIQPFDDKIKWAADKKFGVASADGSSGTIETHASSITMVAIIAAATVLLA
ncbi:glycoside hydrolase superfamily [Powellomyces hirtus]|nr:glycoside hydrolase superfamily [Powellomyces hirtus]